MWANISSFCSNFATPSEKNKAFSISTLSSNGVNKMPIQQKKNSSLSSILWNSEARFVGTCLEKRGKKLKIKNLFWIGRSCFFRLALAGNQVGWEKDSFEEKRWFILFKLSSPSSSQQQRQQHF